MYYEDEEEIVENGNEKEENHQEKLKQSTNKFL